MRTAIDKRIAQKVPESSVLRACLDLLAAEKIWHMRCNSGALRDRFNRPVRFGRKGMADILAIVHMVKSGNLRIEGTSGVIPDGAYYWAIQPVWIECKSSDGRQSQEQRDFQNEVVAENHVYLLINDIDVLRDWIKKAQRRS